MRSLRQIGLLLIVVSGPALAAAEGGRAVYEAHCGACHELPDPTTFSDDLKRRRLEEMARYSGLTHSQYLELEKYLQQASATGG